MENPLYADILVHHAYARTQNALTYSVPQGMELFEGSGVMVPFQRGQKPGLILKLHSEQPDFKTREIQSILEPNPLLRTWQMRLSEWITEYYFCSNYDALKLFLPQDIWRAPKATRKSATKEKILEPKSKLTLTPDQEAIVQHFLKEKPKQSLLHGITGSGKTEIYLRLIQAAIDEGKQALLLVPEIGLTPQLLRYFESHFPNTAVLHSRVSQGRKAKLWQGIHSGEIPLVIGSRSALFSPFKNLGLIVMDEEHDSSYKQDQSPRYHAKEVALKITDLTGTQLLLGSATPSLETRLAAEEGKLHYYQLKERISGTPLPKVEVVDLRDELKGGNHSIFSFKLEQKISAALQRKEQVILFLNRRGSASSTVCRDCGFALTCSHCESKLTYHARNFAHQTLVCHHCGALKTLPKLCPNCQGTRIKHFGLGTERVETELQKLFPSARIQRADKDTMSKVESFNDLHKALRNDEIDILIGTQMIAKGLDLPGVSLIGVILADLGLHMPDFRASERSFQLLTQVGGRAGRRKTQGEVILQSYCPEHPAIQFAKEHDYEGFYKQEIKVRKEAGYPPFSQAIKLTYVDASKEVCAKAAAALEPLLKDAQHEVWMAPALFPKLKGKYYWNVVIQGPQAHQKLKSLDPELLKGWRIDVDPLQTV